VDANVACPCGASFESGDAALAGADRAKLIVTNVDNRTFSFIKNLRTRAKAPSRVYVHTVLSFSTRLKRV
jgi:hypothetical protein